MNAAPPAHEQLKKSNKRHHTPEVGESHPTHDATLHIPAFESPSHSLEKVAQSEDVANSASYLIRNDIEMVVDEDEETREEAASKESGHPTPFIQQRDHKLKDIARTFRSEDWAGLGDDQLAIRKYTGGLSNKLYRCTSLVDPHQKILIRVTGSSTQEDGSDVSLADRDGELLVFQAVYKAGLGPKFYGKYKNGCVYGHVDGVQLTIEEVHKPEYAALIAKRLAQWHAKMEIPDVAREPAWSLLVRKWLDLIPKNDLSHVQREEQKEEWAALGIDVVKEMDELEAMLASLNTPVTFCHNDVQPMNCIYDKESNTVGFIEGWDLGNHFCEHTGFDLDWTKFPSREKQMFFLTRYLEAFLERQPTELELERAYVEANKFTLASHLYWGIWGLAQAKVSDIDYDFFQYSLRRLTMYTKTKAALYTLPMPQA
ncbi:GmCK3p, putative [Acanthamoeba castellanii str. Neff]|uniref:ethanolamine kinase n=1 Tax=Acanthamoeba castellanii (strain ATCC 30010 / Neff) TaxID=1257118 RepID=L8GF68_ACACF|nr:GmCK3p, putative [Acanthamoeba castellanii str. Neff]ELR11514.1 GmCK3p, putative [Acanthamoeba castellanii str. Neff]